MELIAKTIRSLALDAVEQAGSGHAGTPLGCADMGAYLYGSFLRYCPTDPQWINRDRFILSAGHASLLQYICLHLAGFNLPLEEIKRFRQIDSKTPSHPQFGITDGVETTTGVDGQGIAHGIGQALGLKILSAKVSLLKAPLLDAKVIVLAGDGCFMEGISHEASSLAGHWQLDNLIIIYDRNKTSLDGYVSETFSEDIRKRYESYNWDVAEVDGHDIFAIDQLFSGLRKEQKKPTLVIMDTVIGKGLPAIAGSYLTHSGPVSDTIRNLAKKEMGFPNQPFYIPSEVKTFFQKRNMFLQQEYHIWEKKWALWKDSYPELVGVWEQMSKIAVTEKDLQDLHLPSEISGRMASHEVLQYLASQIPALYGGSADLSRSDMTWLSNYDVITASNFKGRNLKYGVREFAMGGIAIGLAQTRKILPYVGTFLAFSDYMINAIRMAALMKLKVIYQLTHDSIWIGQDGPTHQPIEQLVHLRSIPNLLVIRPCDSNEVKMAWLAALRYDGPTALIFSRQIMIACPSTNVSFEEGLSRGAYFVYNPKNKSDIRLIATGSEVAIACEVAKLLEDKGFIVAVISMPSWELFEVQSAEYKKTILGPEGGFYVSIEAGSIIGWHRYVDQPIGIDQFGLSATCQQLAERFSLTPQAICSKILSCYDQFQTSYCPSF